tara:strand:+ start:264 stop:512 length:249 start_codon:yes stop_codon:yes gene_type:complete
LGLRERDARRRGGLRVFRPRFGGERRQASGLRLRFRGLRLRRRGLRPRGEGLRLRLVGLRLRLLRLLVATAGAFAGDTSCIS